MADRDKLIEGLIEDFHAIRHKLVLDGQLFSDENQITLSQLIVLRIAAKYDGISIKKIAGKLGITSSAVTQLVSGLVNKGYLKREGSEVDRRSLRVGVSGQGREKIEALKIQGLEKLTSMFDVFDDEELEKYCELNKKIADRILSR
jgi:DNA-binding MarR family transcriptional regulator